MVSGHHGGEWPPSPSPSSSPSSSSSSSLWQQSFRWFTLRDDGDLGAVRRSRWSGREKTNRKMALITALVILTLICSPIPVVDGLPAAFDLIEGFGNVAKGSQAILRRLASERERRDDSQGEEQVQRLLDSLKASLSWWKGAFGVGYDFAYNYYWKKQPLKRLELGPAINNVQGLMVALDEFRERTSSKSQRDRWISDNWEKISKLTRDLVNELLRFFDRTGQIGQFLREFKKELKERGFMEDLLKLSAGDFQSLLKGLRQLMEYFQHRYAADGKAREEL